MKQFFFVVAPVVLILHACGNPEPIPQPEIPRLIKIRTNLPSTKKDTVEKPAPASKKTEQAPPPYDSHILYKDTMVMGYFNCDTIADTVWLMVPMPENKWVEWGCEPCKAGLMFSTHEGDFYWEGDIGGRLENIGDLDEDGMDELAYINGWFWSCWGNLGVFSFKNNRWKMLKCVFFPRCGFERTLKSRFKRVNDRTISLLAVDPTIGDTTLYIHFPVVR